jgi:hypothetical protein
MMAAVLVCMGSTTAAEQPAHRAFLGFGYSSESRPGLRSYVGGHLGASDRHRTSLPPCQVPWWRNQVKEP